MYDNFTNILVYEDGEERFIGSSDDIERNLFFRGGKIVNVDKFYIVYSSDAPCGWSKIEVSEKTFRRYLEGRRWI